MINAGAQHFVECSTCKRSAQFHCNSCGDRLCEVCKAVHQTSNATRNHNIVMYNEKQNVIAAEPCQQHRHQTCTMFCEKCQVPVCMRCVTNEHKGHMFSDLESFLVSLLEKLNDGVLEIKNTILPRGRAVQENIKVEQGSCKEKIKEMRSQMKSNVQSIKDSLDRMLGEKLNCLDRIEKTLISELEKQDKTVNEYVVRLQNVVEGFNNVKKMKSMAMIISFQNEVNAITEIPHFPPISLPALKLEDTEKHNFSLAVGEILESSNQEIKQTTEILEGNKSTPIITVLAKNSSTLVQGCHISGWADDKAFVSDYSGKLRLVSIDGKQLHELKYPWGNGIHTMADTGELLFLTNYGMISRLTTDMNTQTFISDIPHQPKSIHVSRFNREILVGTSPAKIIKYNSAGDKLGQIESVGNREYRFTDPWYITGNINGDVCISDFENAVIVFDESGNPRFAYRGSSGLHPFGICTDDVGRILVCDDISASIHVIDIDGNFLTYLTDENQQKVSAYGVCMVKDKLWTVKDDIMSVYKYKN